MSGHTRGPWKCDWTRAGKNAWKIVGSDHLGVATILVAQARNATEKESNARLISAAPDLLAFAKAYVKWVETGSKDDTFFYTLAKAAIAAATGETK